MGDCDNTLLLSVKELVSSGCLSAERIFMLFNHEDNVSIDCGTAKNPHSLNAAKVSLLLAQTISKFDSERVGVDLTSLNLDNFFVKVAPSSSNLEPLGVEAIRDPLDMADGELFYALAQMFDGEEDADQSHACEDEAKTEEKQSDESYSCDDKEKFDKINATSGSICWTLLGMEVRGNQDSLSSGTISDNSLSPIQFLGMMICEIFSTEDNMILQIINNQSLVREETTAQDNKPYSSDQRRLKQKNNEDSLFSELSSSSGRMPISTCRLLSDAIDATANTPYNTIEELIEDLQQMTSIPQIFLDDPVDDFFSSNLRFGLSCYGRTEQVKSFLKVASGIENSYQKVAPNSDSDCVEAVFVSGVGGSGKTFLIQNIGEYLTHQDWIIIGAKFEYGLEHESRDVVARLFSKLISKIVSLRDGGNCRDVEYARRVATAILDGLDRDDLSSLVNFIPSLAGLIHGINVSGYSDDAASEGNSYWRLVFLLSSLLGAILSASEDRNVLIYFDDLQWCHGTMMGLISEVVISMGWLSHARKRVLFVGLYRDDEISNSHTSQLEVLQSHQHVNVTNINITSFDKEHVTEMLMSEMRLPKRLVVDFADTIYQKSGQGHPLFVVQLLNSLVRDSIVMYSPRHKRYCWEDSDRLSKLQTWDSVAKLVVSNLSSLPADALNSLRILACLGMQTQKSILHHLKSCSELEGANDICSFLPILIDAGIVEDTGSIKFCHDIIREGVYHSVTVEQRQAMHLLIAQCLGSKATFPEYDTHGECAEEKKTEALDVQPQSLVCVATDHANIAIDLIVNEMQRARYAYWNQAAATETARSSNFQSALFYYKSGISFLGSSAWAQDTYDLSYDLHIGAAAKALAIGKAEEVRTYANAIVNNVPFEQSLEAQCLIIRSLEYSSKNHETIDVALAVLKKLGFSIPTAPELVKGKFPTIVMERMERTSQAASQHDFQSDLEASEVQQSKRRVLSIFDAMVLACLRLRSPYLPLIACEAIQYSIAQNCVCAEAALSFALFGFLKLAVEDDFSEAKHWANISFDTLRKECRPFTRTKSILHCIVFPWLKPLRESASDLYLVYETGMKYGQVQYASLTLAIHLRHRFFEGEHLSTLLQVYNSKLSQIAKFNKEAGRHACLDMILISALTGGVDCNPFSLLGGIICDENALLADALTQKKMPIAMAVYCRRLFECFWFGNIVDARRWSKLAANITGSFPWPMANKLHLHWIRGILAFICYRDGHGDDLFDEGSALLAEMEKWLERAKYLFQNKVHLMKAEYFASTCEVNKAKEEYIASIKSAKGRINEQALAYELMGNYLKSIVEIPDANECYTKAVQLYIRWGAHAKAKQIQTAHNLKMDNSNLCTDDNTKRTRDSSQMSTKCTQPTLALTDWRNW